MMLVTDAFPKDRLSHTIPALETPLPTELIRHSDLTSARCLNVEVGLIYGKPSCVCLTNLASSLFLLTQTFQPSSFVRIGPATSEMSDGDERARAMEELSGALLQGRLFALIR